MSAAARPAKPCPAWCQHEADGDRLHLSEVHEIGELLLSLSQHFGEARPVIGICDETDQEMFLSPDEAERAGKILLELARAGRRAACRAA